MFKSSKVIGGCQLLGHVLLLLLVAHPTHGGAEEEEAQNGKHDEKLQEDKSPERAPQGHLAETIQIKVENSVQ